MAHSRTVQRKNPRFFRENFRPLKSASAIPYFRIFDNMNEKKSILNFITKSIFRKAPNAPKFIYKQYTRITKSKISWDDFIRLIYELEKDGYLIKSTGLNGEDLYFLVNRKREKLSEKSPYLDWAIKAFISAILTTSIGLLIALPKFRKSSQKSKQQDTLIHNLSQRIDSLEKK